MPLPKCRLLIHNVEVNRALFVKNLSYNVTPEELFELFGKFGPIRYVPSQRTLHSSPVAKHTDSIHSQVRQGIANATKGTAFVVYEDVMDAKQACDKLNGFNFQNRYLVGASTCHLSFTLIQLIIKQSYITNQRR